MKQLLTKHKRGPIKETQWLLLNAENKVLGRVASKVARLLRGKHKSTFSPHRISGDAVVVTNIGK
ncbi:uL13 family ribosomal protein, partial [Candidatus Margulisiibacteriota bacterium]